MDIETREHFWSIIEKLKQAACHHSLYFHYIEEVERMADQVVLLDQGQIQLDDSPEHIKTLKITQSSYFQFLMKDYLMT